MNRDLIRGLAIGAVAATVCLGIYRMLGSPSDSAGKSAKDAKLPPPADVKEILKEAQINTVRLRPEAAARLKLATATVEKKPMPRTRIYGGEVMVPPGRTIFVTAPLSGLLRAPGNQVPQPRQAVKKGEVLFQLLPLLTPEGKANLASAKIDAEGQTRSAKAQLDAARIALERAERVFKSEAGSQRAVDEAKAQVELAQKAFDQASSRGAMLEKLFGDSDQANASLPIESPEQGMIRNINSLPGQNVPAGTPLLEVVDLRRVWIRVPVFVGDAPEIDASSEVRVGDITARPGELKQTARRAAAPPSANAAAGTVDLFYELDNPGNRLSPGQRLAVVLPLAGNAESLTVPWSAVVHDLYGGAWVYEVTGELTYTRKRVAVAWVDGPTAVLDRGPTPGTAIVTNGAAELFGAETGFTK